MDYTDYEDERRSPLGAIIVAVSLALLLAASGALYWAMGRSNAPPVRPPTDERPVVTAETVRQIRNLMFEVAYLATSIALLVWVARDTRNRGMDSGAIWMLIVLAFNLIGLIIYMASRPAGQLVPCDNCGNRRLHYVRVCPHCHGSTV
jgi:Phospholipase_D-nuclease N-terminal